MTAQTHSALASVSEPTLYVAFELGARDWVMATSVDVATRPWIRRVPAGDLEKVMAGLGAARARYGLSPMAPVVSCYEAGRDGFWIHHALAQRGVHNRVVDSASIEVNRRARRAKTDRLDAAKLVTMLMRVCQGEARVWREVRVPPVAVEAARHSSRERQELVAEQTRLVNQMRSWLALVGAALPARRSTTWWREIRDWADAPLARELQERLARASARATLVAEQITALEAAQRAAVSAAPASSGLARLAALKGIGATSATILMQEALQWRAFANRREVGGFIGFTPVPYQSGAQARDQGIDHAGNRRLRATVIQLAWQWLRWQRGSALAQWYEARFADRGPRARRIGIVALGRKLFIALWRWATAGDIPAGARLKVA
jgi:transposase